MKLKRSLIASATAGLTLLIVSQAPVLAEPPSAPHVQSQDMQLGSIREAVILPGDTVEV